MEADDKAFLVDRLRGMGLSGKPPFLQILVGEGNDPAGRMAEVHEYLDAAVEEGLFDNEYRNTIEVLPGSSSPNAGDPMHRYLNSTLPDPRNNPRLDEVGTPEESQRRISEALLHSAQQGVPIRYFELKPVGDLLEIAGLYASGLTERPATAGPKGPKPIELFVSGAHNVSVVITKEPNKTAAVRQLVSDLFNSPLVKTTYFAGFNAYEEHGLPKHVKRFKSPATEAERQMDQLALAVASDTRPLGRLRVQGISRWNEAVSLDCAQTCLDLMLRQFDDRQFEIASYRTLANMRRDLENSIRPGVNIAAVNSEFIQRFNEAVFGPGSSQLTGNEQHVEDYPQTFTRLFPTVEDFSGEPWQHPLIRFNLNWKVLGSIAGDPLQGIIGDASLGPAAEQPGLFKWATGRLAFNRSNHAYIEPGTENDGSVAMIAGVANWKDLVAHLHPDFGTGRALERAPERR